MALERKPIRTEEEEAFLRDFTLPVEDWLLFCDRKGTSVTGGSPHRIKRKVKWRNSKSALRKQLVRAGSRY
jgi:hypothetical protein